VRVNKYEKEYEEVKRLNALKGNIIDLKKKLVWSYVIVRENEIRVVVDYINKKEKKKLIYLDHVEKN